jgi:hypothetical protein
MDVAATRPLTVTERSPDMEGRRTRDATLELDGTIQRFDQSRD